MKLFTLTNTIFENFDNSINNYLSKIFANLGIQYSDNQIFKIIFNGIRGVFQNIMIYIEDAFTEQNIETATRKKSIYSLAKLSGYEPYYGTAATGILKASLISNTNLSKEIKKIYIDNHINIQNNENNINYILFLQTNRYVFDINNPLVNYDFNIVQGYFKTSTYTSKGEELESIHLNINGMYDKNYIKVYVNNIEWQPVSNLYDMTQNGNEYVISAGFDNELDITFGNSVYGRIPDQGSNIVIEYIIHDGEEGNITNIDNVSFTFLNNGYDYNGNQINLNNYIKLEATNYISGGTNSDTIDDIRKMIGYTSRSNVLASIENYTLFLKHFSFIGNFNIWAENNSNTLMISAISNKINKIKDISEYKDITNKDLVLTDEQKNNIITVLKNSKNTFAGIQIKFIDPIIYKYAIICYVKSEDSYYNNTIESNIQNTIIEYFSELNYNVSFVAKSDIIKYVLENVSHIKSLSLDIISEANEQAFYNGYYYKYSNIISNTRLTYDKTKYNYESNLNLGLDKIGNISIDNNLYLPLLHGDILYYPEKSSYNKESSMRLDAVNIIFI